MAEDESKSLDILGLKPYGDSLKILTQATVDGTAAFLSRICLPAAEEFGLLLRDRVSGWRVANTISIAAKAEKKLNTFPDAENWHAHPRIVASVIVQGSWSDDDQVQEMWAGLLASSCTEDGKDESNLIFIHILSQLTSSEVFMLKTFCEKVTKSINEGGLIWANPLTLSANELTEITNISDIHRLDRELDHLRSLQLIHHGFSTHSTFADVSPTPLALNLYVRCQGYNHSPVEYFGLTEQVAGESS